jgi:hypothetical protein
MLTDIFATRYEYRPIWTEGGERERTLIVQMWRIIKEQVMTYWDEKGQVNKSFAPLWKDVALPPLRRSYSSRCDFSLRERSE